MTGETWDGFPRLVGSFFGYVSVQLEGSFKPLTGILSWWQTNRTQQPSQLPHLATIVGRIPTGIACPRPRDGQVEVYNILCIYNIHNIYILHNIHTYVYISIYIYIIQYTYIYIYIYWSSWVIFPSPMWPQNLHFSMGISQPCRPRGFVASTPTPCAAAAAAALLVTGRGAAGEAKDTATAGGVLRTREVGDDSGNKYYGIIPSYIYMIYGD